MIANGLSDEINSLNSLLSLLEKKRLSFNRAVKQRSTILKDLIEINKKIAYEEVIQDFKAYKKQLKACDAAREDSESCFVMISPSWE